MRWDWEAFSSIATAVGTLVALCLAVYNIRQGRKNERKAIVDKAFGIALELVDVVGEFYRLSYDRFAPSMAAVKGRYLIRLLDMYGYSCDEHKVFNNSIDTSFDELDRLFEQIKRDQ